MTPRIFLFKAKNRKPSITGYRFIIDDFFEGWAAIAITNDTKPIIRHATHFYLPDLDTSELDANFWYLEHYVKDRLSKEQP